MTDLFGVLAGSPHHCVQTKPGLMSGLVFFKVLAGLLSGDRAF